jgi:hemin uptake protein HemP
VHTQAETEFSRLENFQSAYRMSEKRRSGQSDVVKDLNIAKIESFQSSEYAVDGVTGPVRCVRSMEKPSKMRRHKRAVMQTSDSEGADPPLEIDTRELLGRRQEATIIHAGERYRLRVTANNKLILTK